MTVGGGVAGTPGVTKATQSCDQPRKTHSKQQREEAALGLRGQGWEKHWLGLSWELAPHSIVGSPNIHTILEADYTL